MKTRHLLILCLSYFVLVSCVQEVSNNQPNESPIPVSSTQMKPLTQSKQSQDLTMIKSGTFISGEHTTKGTVRITNKDGKSFIKTEFRSQESEFSMNSVRLVDESRGLKPPLNLHLAVFNEWRV